MDARDRPPRVGARAADGGAVPLSLVAFAALLRGHSPLAEMAATVLFKHDAKVPDTAFAVDDPAPFAVYLQQPET